MRVGGEWAHVCLLAGLANRGITGHSAGTGRTADLVMAAFATVFCQIFVGRFGVSFSPFERLFLGRFGFGQSCGLSVIA